MRLTIVFLFFLTGLYCQAFSQVPKRIKLPPAATEYIFKKYPNANPTWEIKDEEEEMHCTVIDGYTYHRAFFTLPGEYKYTLSPIRKENLIKEIDDLITAKFPGSNIVGIQLKEYPTGEPDYLVALATEDDAKFLTIRWENSWFIAGQ